MLDSMRGIAKGFVSKALMMFLVLTFAVWGVGDVVRSGSNHSLVKVGKESITPGQFMAEQRAMRQSLEAMGVKGIDPQALGNEVLRRMVQEKLIAQWQRDTGLVVNRSTLSQAIAQEPMFKGDNGKFDPRLFQLMLQQRQTNEGTYLSQLSHEIGGKAMVASLDLRDVKAPESIVAITAAAGTQTRDAVLITVPVASVSPASVSSDDMTTYYNANQSAFTQPERRTIEYVVLDSASLKAAAEKSVTDEATAAEQREQAIQDIAMNIEDALAGGSSMGEAIAESGVKSQSHVLTNVGEEGSGDNALERAVLQHGFDLSEGESSSLQTSEDGRYFMVTVKDVTPAAPKKLEEVSAEVRRAVAAEQSRGETKARMQLVKQALSEGKSWQEAAKAGNAQARTVSNIGRPAVNVDGSLKETGTIPALLQQALFEHKVGGVAGPITRDNGEQVVALVTNIRTTPNSSAKARDAAEAEYHAQLGNSVSASVFRELASRYDVVVNQPMLQQVMGQANE